MSKSSHLILVQVTDSPSVVSFKTVLSTFFPCIHLKVKAGSRSTFSFISQIVLALFCSNFTCWVSVPLKLLNFDHRSGHDTWPGPRFSLFDSVSETTCPNLIKFCIFVMFHVPLKLLNFVHRSGHGHRHGSHFPYLLISQEVLVRILSNSAFSIILYVFVNILIGIDEIKLNNMDSR